MTSFALPFALSLPKGRPSLEGQGFDKLSPNGEGGGHG
jgi:hypothetical protein